MSRLNAFIELAEAAVEAGNASPGVWTDEEERFLGVASPEVVLALAEVAKRAGRYRDRPNGRSTPLGRALAHLDDVLGGGA